jgi:hypothetical protein
MGQFQLPIMMLDYGSTGMEPIAAIVIRNAVDCLDAGMVAMANDHTVEASALGLSDKTMLEGADKKPRELVINGPRYLCCQFAKLRQPAGPTYNADIELITVQHEKASFIHSHMNGIERNYKRPYAETCHFAHEGIVISGYVNQRNPSLHLSMQHIQNSIMGIWPIDADAIEDIANQIDGLGFMGLQELQQPFGLTVA